METELAQKFATAAMIAITSFAFGVLFVEFSTDRLVRITGRAMVLCAFLMLMLFCRHCVTRESAMVAEQRLKNLSDRHVADLVVEHDGVTVKWNRYAGASWTVTDKF